jgi:hypothetical protein
LTAPAAQAKPRAFKTAWFAKVARKARITDKDLCDALKEVQQGQADPLGGGVYKKRLDKNRHRSIILAKGGRHWVYQYLFAKKDRANIDDAELNAFRALAERYEALTTAQITSLLGNKDFKEICHGGKA